MKFYKDKIPTITYADFLSLNQHIQGLLFTQAQRQILNKKLYDEATKDNRKTLPIIDIYMILLDSLNKIMQGEFK